MRGSSRRWIAATIVGIASVGLLGACGDDGGTSSSSAPTVTDAWARASAQMQSAGAAYMTITGGKTDDVLLRAAVPADVAAKAEIHETVMASGSTGSTGMSGSSGMGSGASGMMTIREVANVVIPAGTSVALAPGGYHIMLLDLPKALATGQKFTITLTFEKAGAVVVPVAVRAS